MTNSCNLLEPSLATVSEEKSNTEAMIITEWLDITRYPTLDKLHPANLLNNITKGDLHGNALLFIHFLVKQNILIIEEKQYQEFVKIYQTDVSELTQSELDNFKKMLKDAKVNPATVRLLGDTLCDRGKLDYFILLILECLQEGKVNLEIIFSNHDDRFLRIYETTQDYNEASVYNGQGRSAENMASLINKNLIQKEQINVLVEKYYKPNLRLLSYSMDEKLKKFRVYTHAPVGLETLAAIFEQEHIVNVAATSQKEKIEKLLTNDIQKVIDKINKKFALTVQARKIHIATVRQQNDYDEWCKSRKIKAIEREVNIPLAQAIFRLIWNRMDDCDTEDWDEYFKEHSQFNDVTHPLTILINNVTYGLEFFHGHSGRSQSTRPALKTLDSDLGQSDSITYGEYKVSVSQDTTATKLLDVDARKRQIAIFEQEIKNYLAILKTELKTDYPIHKGSTANVGFWSGWKNRSALNGVFKTSKIIPKQQ